MSGNGIGIEVSKIRGKGERINGSGGTASGTLSYVSMINEVARHIMQGNIHRSACHSAVHWKHKDVYQWLTSKQWDAEYTRLKSISYDYPAPFDTFNLSIRYDTDFIEAYHNPENEDHTYAVDLWKAHTRVMFEFSDPSIQFDHDNNILRNACCEIISDTNGDSCHLASVNLANIKGYPELEEVVSMMTKFMMVVKNVDTYALPFMRDIGLSNGRLGLGTMGMHNWLLQRKLPYQWCDDLYGLFDTYTYTAREQAYETAKQYGFSEPVALFAQAPTGKHLPL
jgi:ribonucleoside-diphosphate reductase alpha chain